MERVLRENAQLGLRPAQCRLAQSLQTGQFKRRPEDEKFIKKIKKGSRKPCIKCVGTRTSIPSVKVGFSPKNVKRMSFKEALLDGGANSNLIRPEIACHLKEVDPLSLSPQVHKGEVGKSRSSTAAEDHINKANVLRRSSKNLLVYSDGSRRELRSQEGLRTGEKPSRGRMGVGAGWCVYRGRREVHSDCISLGSNRAEVFDAEAVGLSEGLKAVVNYAATSKAIYHIYLFTDNAAVMRLAKKGAGQVPFRFSVSPTTAHCRRQIKE